MPAFFSRQYGFKLIYVVYDIYPDMACRFGYLRENSISTKLFNKVNKYVYSHCDKIVVLSNEMKQHFVNNIGHSDKLVVIPNWYNNTKQISKKNSHNDLRILYGGNIGIVQDIDTLCDGIIALRDEKDIKFYFAAHGSKADKFFLKIKDNDTKTVINKGFMLKSSYDNFLENVDMAIISIDKKVLGLASPSKFYSYISKGVPIIFIGPKEMDVAQEIINNKIGFVIDNGDVDSFKSILLAVKADKSVLEPMGVRARELFEKKYTNKICAEKYVSIIQSIKKNE